MKRFCVIFLMLGLILPAKALATVYRYMDSQGYERYTNDLSTVPPDKLPDVKEYNEIQTDESIPPAKIPSYTIPATPSVDTTEQNNAAEDKKALEEEYSRLLKAREALNNDKSFQKRRYKREWKHRPYIRKLVEKEAQINARMAEIEKELKKY